MEPKPDLCIQVGDTQISVQCYSHSASISASSSGSLSEIESGWTSSACCRFARASFEPLWSGINRIVVPLWTTSRGSPVAALSNALKSVFRSSVAVHFIALSVHEYTYVCQWEI